MWRHVVMVQLPGYPTHYQLGRIVFQTQKEAVDFCYHFHIDCPEFDKPDTTVHYFAVSQEEFDSY